jgi:flagellar biosynthesis/type III secretory pathway protein FliH
MTGVGVEEERLPAGAIDARFPVRTSKLPSLPLYKKRRKEGGKRGRKEGTKEQRTSGRKEQKTKGRKEGTKKGTKEGREGGREEGRKEGTTITIMTIMILI